MPVDRNDVVVPARPSSWLRRPPGLVARTRWLFCLCALVTLVLALSRPVMAGRGTPALYAAAAVMALLWIARYASGRSPLVLDLAEAVAVAATALSGADVAAMFNVVFPALWFRALFGTTPRVRLYCMPVSEYIGIVFFSAARYNALSLPTISAGIFAMISSGECE